MKKALCILLTFALFFGVACVAKASSDVSYRVYAEETTVTDGKVTIPVKIENNGGFMGFAIKVDYDSSILTPVSVSKGSMLSGMLDDSIGKSGANSIKIVYAGSSDVTSDGELFTIEFSSTRSDKNKVEITITSLNEETYDESYNDVVFNCEKIVLIYNNGSTNTSDDSDSTKPSETVVPDDTTKADDSESSTNPDETTKPEETTKVEDDEGDDVKDKLSVRIKKWAAGLAKPFNSIMSVIVAPLVFVISLFE